MQQTIVDVGANIGNHALFFSQFLRWERIICFEPFPANAAVLRENVGQLAEIHQCALGSSEKRAGLRFSEENFGICIVDQTLPPTIAVRTLDSFALNDVSLVKIDVEGDDLEVLRGAQETLRRCTPIVVVEGDFPDLFGLLAPLGYLCVACWKHYQTYCFLHPGRVGEGFQLPALSGDQVSYCWNEVPQRNFRMVCTAKQLRAFYERQGWHYNIAKYLAQHPEGGASKETEAFRDGSAAEAPLACYQLRDLLLVGRIAILVTASGHVLGESALYPRLSLQLPPEERVLADIPARDRKKGAYVALVGVWSQYFWHWLMEYLPRVLIAEQSGFDGRYIVGQNAPSFVRQSLALLGIAEERIVEKGDGSWWVEELFMPEVLTGTLGHDRRSLEQFPALVRALREQLLARAPTGEGSGQALYISRRRAPRGRHVLNEEAVAKLLQPLGFALLEMEQLSLGEQLALSRSARILVGPHGAGMAHMLFMPEESVVIELVDPQGAQTSCQSAISLLRHRHYSIPSLIVGGGNQPSAMIADLFALERLLKEVQ